MEKIAIVVDSSSGIKSGELEDVFVLPLSIIEIKNGKSITYSDGIDITNEQLCDKIKAGENISTSQVSIGQIMNLMDEIESKYERIYVLPIPGTLSGSINTWQLATQEFKKLFIVPQHMISIMVKWTVIDFMKMREKNELNDESALAYVEKIKERRAAAVLVPDIKQLVKGGRISNFKSFLIEKLGLKLVLSLDQNGLKLFGKSGKIDGCLDVMEKYFKKEKGLGNNPSIHATILFCENPDGNFKIDEIIAKVRLRWPELKFEVGSLPAVIVAHTGVNYVAVGFDCRD